MEGLSWTWINAIVQWLVLPMIAIIWTHEKRLNGNDKEILRLLTILEERERNRSIIREQEHDTNLRLEQLITEQARTQKELASELHKLAEALAAIRGQASVGKT